MAVRMVQSARDVRRDPHGRFDREPVLTGEFVAQGLAADVGQDIPQEAVALARVD